MRPYLRAANITWDGFDLSDVKEMNFDEADFATFRLRSGDVLLNEGSGSANEVGKAAVWEEQIRDCCFQNTLLCFRSDHINPWYAQAFFAHSATSGRLIEHTKGVNIYHIGKKNLERFPMPVPPLAEQRRITAKLDALTARIVRARADLSSVLRRAEHLRKVTLGDVFSEIVSDARLTSFSDKLSLLTSGSRDWAKFYDRGSSVFVLAGNVRSLAFDPKPRRLVDPPLDGPDARRSKVLKDDLLITIVGAGTGDICRVSDHYPNYFVCQSVARAVLRDTRLAAFYAYWFVSPSHGRADFEAAIYGAARPHLSFDQIQSFMVPDVSITVADEAVARIEAAFARADGLEAEATRAAKLLDRLEASIRSKAFRGELVTQDPSDEPASALLARIHAERDETPKPKRGRRAAAAGP